MALSSLGNPELFHPAVPASQVDASALKVGQIVLILFYGNRMLARVTQCGPGPHAWSAENADLDAVHHDVEFPITVIEMMPPNPETDADHPLGD